MGLPQYGNQDIRSERVYFAGATQLLQGQPLCYDIPGSSAPSANTTKTDDFGMATKIPVTANIPYFAGILSPGDEGKTGPTFVDIDKPALGDILVVRVDGTTDIAVGDGLTLDNATGVFIKNAAPAVTDSVILKALQAFTTDGAGVIWAFRHK